MMIVSMVPMIVVMFISQELITSVQNPTLADIENSNLQMSLLSNIAYLPGMFVVSQLSLVLPASALGKTRDLGWSWVKTEGNRFRVFLLLGLIPILISLVSYLIPEYESLWLTFVVLAIGIYLMTFEIALLSLCYRELCKDDADADTDEDRTTHTDENPRDQFEA